MVGVVGGCIDVCVGGNFNTLPMDGSKEQWIVQNTKSPVSLSVCPAVTFIFKPYQSEHFYLLKVGPAIFIVNFNVFEILSLIQCLSSNLYFQ